MSPAYNVVMRYDQISTGAGGDNVFPIETIWNVSFQTLNRARRSAIDRKVRVFLTWEEVADRRKLFIREYLDTGAGADGETSFGEVTSFGRKWKGSLHAEARNFWRLALLELWFEFHTYFSTTL